MATVIEYLNLFYYLTRLVGFEPTKVSQSKCDALTTSPQPIGGSLLYSFTSDRSEKNRTHLLKMKRSQPLFINKERVKLFLS